MADISKMLKFIASCDDPEQLKVLIKNARQSGGGDAAAQISNAAFKKLISIVPSEVPGTVEHDFWQTVHAFEYALSEERGKTTRLTRTRQKVSRVGVIQTLNDWALSRAETNGFRMLLDRDFPELTGEAIVLRHADRFGAIVVSAARQRLADAGVEVNALPTTAG